MPIVFSQRFLHCLATSLAYKQSGLNALAQQCIQGLGAFLEQSTDTALRVAVLVALQRQGSAGFDYTAQTSFTSDLIKVRPQLDSLAACMAV